MHDTNKKAQVHPKQWELVLRAKDWNEEEKDSILALLVVEIAYMADFIKDYKPLWTIDDLPNKKP